MAVASTIRQFLPAFRSAAVVFQATRPLSGGPSNAMATSVYSKLTHMRVTQPAPFVLHVQLCRPDKLNSMTLVFFDEIAACFGAIGEDPDCRAVVLSAEGKHFSAGLDLADAAQIMGNQNPDLDTARRAAEIRRTIIRLQSSMSSLEKCSKPVLAAVHGGCIGGGVDLISAADVRYCTSDAFFSIKEVDLGLAADIGSLQRVPKVMGNSSLVAELAFTGRRLPADEALRAGLVSRVLPSREDLLKAALDLAGQIAAKSPVAVQTTKRALTFARDYPVSAGLDQIAAENSAMLQSEDVAKAVAASFSKEAPNFAKL